MTISTLDPDMAIIFHNTKSIKTTGNHPEMNEPQTNDQFHSAYIPLHNFHPERLSVRGKQTLLVLILLLLPLLLFIPFLGVVAVVVYNR